MTSSGTAYDPGADLGWLLRRPWILAGRLTGVLWKLGSLALVLLVQGNSRDGGVQQRLAKRIFTTLTGLGPCFIK
ncbi:MAG: AarF/ABC1/UbiB kinase family protein, partial [Cyanobium sp.]